MKNAALQYFQAFCRKDLTALRAMFAPAVSLTDWEIKAAGIDAVLAANAGIFSAVASIAAVPLNVYVDGTTVIAELEITINGTERIKVVDIIEFDAAGKIAAIRAYKG